MANPYADLIPGQDPYADLAPGGVTQDVLKSMLYAPAKAAAGFIGLPKDVSTLASSIGDKLPTIFPKQVQNATALATFGLPMAMRGIASILPGSADVRSALEKVTGPWYDPQTRAGQVADTATQVATTMGRNLLTTPAQAALQVAGITGGTEGMGLLTHDDPSARFVGGLLGGGIPAVVNAAKSRPGVVLAKALGDLSPADVAAAQARQDAAASQGLPLLGTESFDRGHQLAAAVRASPSGNPIIDAFLAQRPAQVESAATRNILNATGPLNTPTQNTALAQQTATQYIRDAEKARTAAVSPLYDAASQQQLPPAALPQLYNRLQAHLADFPAALFPTQNSAIAPYLKAITDPAASNPANMDRLYQSARNAADLSPINATPEQKNIAAALSPVAGALGDAAATNPNIALARGRYQRITQNVIDPMRAGPLGVIAGQAGFDAAAPSAVPRVTNVIADTNVARPSTIRDTYQALNGTNSQAFPGMVQTHVQNQLNTALGDLRTGPNPTAGPRFRQALVGTPQDQANFDEMMRGVAQARGLNANDVVRGANNLLDTLDLMGRTPGLGSPTNTRATIQADMSKSVTGDVARTISGSPLGPWAARMSEWISSGRYADLAKALTAPDSVQQLARMAKFKPDGISARYAAAQALGLDRAISGGQ